MFDPETYILHFVSTLANVRARFGALHVVAARHPGVRVPTVAVMPMRVSASPDYADEGALITVAIDAELAQPPDRERRSIGASLLLRRSLGRWTAEAELGWSGAAIGWDAFDAREVQAAAFEELALELPALVEWLSERFVAELQKLPT